MRRVLSIGLFLIFLSTLATAQPGTPDAVVAVTLGEGGGRGEAHLPGSVLGLPDPAAREDVPTIDPAEVLSLGLGGEIILRFDLSVIVDGPGVDFTVFENAFAYVVGGKERIYAEPGEVAVSRDGVEFKAFPFDSLTLAGCAGVTPTYGDADPYNPDISGGDGFDLALLGLDSIRFIRIRDVSGIVKGNMSHPFYDPTVNGFDLDAVVGINVVSGANLSAVDEELPQDEGRSRPGLQLDLRCR